MYASFSGLLDAPTTAITSDFRRISLGEIVAGGCFVWDVLDASTENIYRLRLKRCFEQLTRLCELDVRVEHYGSREALWSLRPGV